MIKKTILLFLVIGSLLNISAIELDDKVAKTIQESANDLKKSIPKRVDDNTLMTDVEFSRKHKSLSYYYSLTNSNTLNIDKQLSIPGVKDKIKKHMDKLLSNSVCTNSDFAVFRTIDNLKLFFIYSHRNKRLFEFYYTPSIECR